MTSSHNGSIFIRDEDIKDKVFPWERGKSKSRPSIYLDAADKIEVVPKALFTACPREKLPARGGGGETPVCKGVLFPILHGMQ